MTSIYRLGELGEFRNGVNFNRKQFGNGHPVINVKHLYRGRYASTEDLEEIAAGTLKNLGEYEVSKGDILFARSSLMASGAGQVAMVNNFKPRTVFSGFVIRFRIKNKEMVSPLYLDYLLRSPEYRELLTRIASGTTITNLSQTTLSNIQVKLPDVSIQEKVASFLGKIDDKIELIQRMNEILHRIAQALFSFWFFDFEFPSKQGKSYKSSGNEMIDSELGRIPKGWKVKRVEEVCDTFGGGTPSTKNADFWNGKINWAVPSDLTKANHFFLTGTERKITEVGLNNCASKLHPINSILMTSRASIGFFCINKVPIATNQGFIVIEPRRDIDRYYLLNNFQSRISELINNANGTTFLEISRGVFRNLPILLPAQEILKSFHELANPLYEHIFNNEKMIVSLIKTRDYLLPKLISGEIKV